MEPAVSNSAPPLAPRRSPAGFLRLSFSGLFPPPLWDSSLSCHLKILIICFSTDPVLFLFVPAAGVWCQFSDKERERAVKALFIICPWKRSADFFELKKLAGKEGEETQGRGSSPVRLTARDAGAWARRRTPKLARTQTSRPKWIKRQRSPGEDREVPGTWEKLKSYLVKRKEVKRGGNEGGREKFRRQI